MLEVQDSIKCKSRHFDTLPIHGPAMHSLIFSLHTGQYQQHCSSALHGRKTTPTLEHAVMLSERAQQAWLLNAYFNLWYFQHNDGLIRMQSQHWSGRICTPNIYPLRKRKKNIPDAHRQLSIFRTYHLPNSLCFTLSWGFLFLSHPHNPILVFHCIDRVNL